MKIDIRQINEGEESLTLRYRQPTSLVNRIIDLLKDDNKLWGRTDNGNVCIRYDEVLYLESVDDKVFVYTPDNVLRIDGSLSSFLIDASDECFFRCSKSTVININRVTSLKSLSSNRIDAIMEGGEHIIISRRYASEFRKLLRGDR